MAEKWYWLPDFASDMGLWEDDLMVVSPSAKHKFVPYKEMSIYLNNIFDLPGISKANVVVGWGLGALAMLVNADNRPKNQRWILLSPYADFCTEHSEWSPANLSFIAHQSLTAKGATLNAFYEMLSDELGDWQEEWFKYAKKIEPEFLHKGLDFLAKNRFNKVLENENIQVIYGRLDKAIPPKMTLELKKLLPKATFKERAKAGHWPPLLLL